MTVTSETFKRPNSEKIYARSCQVIPSGVNSPVRAFRALMQTPLVVDHGKGDTFWDADDRSYLDYCGSWGALIHGHAHPKIVRTAKKRIEQGSSFGITTDIEAKLAAKIVDLVPSIEKVRFVSSGTEATMSAVRLARGFTGRDLIIKFSGHYHGHADSFLVQAGSGVALLSPTSSSLGVPNEFVKHTLCLPFNDFKACEEAFKKHGSKIACMILEPIAANMGLVFPAAGFLQMLRLLTLKHGALLIFDEVIMGFRASLGGAQELYQVLPDLTCLGKIIGGGFPAAAFGGRAEIMDYLAPQGGVYQAGTLSGNPVAMAAGLQALELCEAKGFYHKLEKKTRALVSPIQEWIKQKNANLCLHQTGSLFTLFFGKRGIENFEDVKECDLKAFAHFFNLLARRGIYISPSQFEACFVSSAHSEKSIAFTRDVMLETLSEMYA